MNKLGIYFVCALLIVGGFWIDYSPQSGKDSIYYNTISKKSFLESMPNKSTIMLGFLNERDKQKELLHFKSIGLNSISVCSNAGLNFEDPDISYILKYYRGEILLKDTFAMDQNAFIDYINSADSFTACVLDNSVLNAINRFTAEKPSYLYHLFHFMKTYAIWCLVFFLLLIGNLRYMVKNLGLFVFAFTIQCYASYLVIINNNRSQNTFIDSTKDLPLDTQNLIATLFKQDIWFLCVFVLIVSLYHFIIKHKIRKSAYFLELTFMYFFIVLMISFLIIEYGFSNYFTYKYQAPGYNYSMAFYTAFPLSICISIGIFFTNKFGKNVRVNVGNLKARVIQSEAELTALQSSVNPHFLYNSLNSIAALADTDPRKTKDMSIALSNFYKYTTNREEKVIATIEEEIKMIENYLIIEKIRFGDRLQYTIKIDEQLKSHTIPYFILQPIIENAIKYGYDKNNDKIDVNIKIESNNSLLIIKIYDSGKAFDDDMNQGYGLRNVMNKLKLLYPTEHTIEFINHPKHVSITIKLNTDV